jgi:hypothetical protein
MEGSNNDNAHIVTTCFKFRYKYISPKNRIGSVGWNAKEKTACDDDDVYLIKNYNIAVGYKIYLHNNTDQPERHKYKMVLTRKICS